MTKRFQHLLPALPLMGLLASNALGQITPALPLINTNFIVNITNAAYGATGDNSTDNTIAIQNAINAAAAGGLTNGLSGGTVQIPAETNAYLCGPITLKSCVNLQIDEGAILRMLPFGRYPVTWFTNNGTNIYFTANNFISASSLTNLEISGNGAIDGQGQPWWPWANTNHAVRPIMLSWSSCNRNLIQDVTLSNSPMFHIAIGGKSGNSTVQGVIIRAPSSGANPPSHNTDACDVSGTNILVQNCDISVGDDNYTCGGGTSGVLLSSNTYGYGHGTSIGSYTSPSVSNITVFSCTFNNTDQGIRIKSDRDRGGFVHNISYLNLSMTNVMRPILIYEQYTNGISAYRAVDSITPGVAASFPSNAVVTNTPIYRDLTISNITATVQPSRTTGLIWGRQEMCISNVTLNKVNITGPKTFGIYCARGVKIIDSQIVTPAGVTNLAFFNAEITFTNSTLTTNVFSLDGASTNGIGSTLSFYNANAWLKNTNALESSPGITLSASTFSISNNLNLPASSIVNFVLGTNAATMAVASNLTLSGTINVSAGAGFTNTTYTLFSCGQTLTWGPPTLGATPAGYNYAFDTNTLGQVRLVVTAPAPSAPTNLVAAGTNLLINLKWNGVTSATTYNLKRGTANGGPYPTVLSGLVATNYADANVTNTVTYYYVVTSTNTSGESTNSLQASATVLPSTVPTNIVAQAGSGRLQLSWPQDHIGWKLEVQTNSAGTGLSTNWVVVPNSQNTNLVAIPIDSANPAVFVRLILP